MFTVDIDIGGTLTDGIVWDGRDLVFVKVDTTPHDLTVCFRECIAEGARRLGFTDTTSFLEEVDLIRWSTTITSNVLAQRTGPKVGLLVTRGHEMDLYGPGRSEAIGSVVQEQNIIGLGIPLNDKEVLLAVKGLLENGVRRIVVSLKGAYYSGENERLIKGLIEEQYPDHFLGTVPVLLGSDISKQADDQTRTHFGIINAYTHSSLASSLFKAEDDLRETHGYIRPLLVGHINGGVAKVAKTRAVDTIESGPTFGLFGSAFYARRYNLSRVVSFDVGGTTTKAGLVVDGQPLLTRQVEICGISVKAPLALLRTLALGGGSVINVDRGSRGLRIGPESMGSYPGPACYDLGGSQATVTDAFVAMGMINPEYFLGGTRRLKANRALEMVGEKVAAPLGVSVKVASQRIVRDAFSQVAAFLEETVRSAGQEPRDFTIFAFGGNGPLFGCGVADALGIDQVQVFGLSPVFSAFGSAISDIVHLYEYSLDAEVWPRMELDKIAGAAGRMRKEAILDLEGEGIGLDKVAFSLELEMRDGGMGMRTIPVPLTAIETQEQFRAVVELCRKGAPQAEAGERLVAGLLRLRATCPMPRYEPVTHQTAGPDASTALKGAREVFWDGKEAKVNIYDWERLRAGNRLSGPVIIEGASTTYFVPDRWDLKVDDYLNGMLKRRGK